jgi:hypothetical protein
LPLEEIIEMEELRKEISGIIGDVTFNPKDTIPRDIADKIIALIIKTDPVAKLHCSDGLSAAALAKRFHETYEKLAPQFSYKTREESSKPWDEVPEDNKNLMIATCAELLKQGI